MVNKDTVGAAITKLMSEKFETFGTDCPVCGQPLLRPKVLNTKTGQKMAGACPNCGYMEDIRHRKIPNNSQLSLAAYRNDALGY